jgi:hypothetical protein
MTKHGTRMPARERDVDPRSEYVAQQTLAWKHLSDPKVACILFNSRPVMGEQPVIGPIVNKSLWELKQALRLQGYMVGEVHLLTDIPHGTVRHAEAYVLPFCQPPLRGELVGLDTESRKVYLSTVVNIDHAIAQDVWSGR